MSQKMVFVRLKGKLFEEKIKNVYKNNNIFRFLHKDSIFHVYYKYKLKNYLNSKDTIQRNKGTSIKKSILYGSHESKLNFKLRVPHMSFMIIILGKLLSLSLIILRLDTSCSLIRPYLDNLYPNQLRKKKTIAIFTINSFYIYGYIFINHKKIILDLKNQFFNRFNAFFRYTLWNNRKTLILLKKYKDLLQQKNIKTFSYLKTMYEWRNFTIVETIDFFDHEVNYLPSAQNRFTISMNN
uniref:Splicing factor 3A subunit 1 n=1 Tax=Amorphochlora amoebiformis TaxID=1561963 RepID=A0A0H5BHM5_9EUKA|nr:splicing factor 3A subunit 1 [Amorphochlora amoebiformis]